MSSGRQGSGLFSQLPWSGPGGLAEGETGVWVLLSASLVRARGIACWLLAVEWVLEGKWGHAFLEEGTCNFPSVFVGWKNFGSLPPKSSEGLVPTQLTSLKVVSSSFSPHLVVLWGDGGGASCVSGAQHLGETTREVSSIYFCVQDSCVFQGVMEMLRSKSMLVGSKA